MRVLFLHSGTQDYQAEALFHGLRCLLGSGCVDVPRYDIMYNTLAPADRVRLRGRGFTLYGLLPDLPEVDAARTAWQTRVGDYDLVVIASVWRQWRQLIEPWVRDVWRKVVIVDGEDAPAFFPYAAHLRRSLRAYVARATAWRYFKREWLGCGADYGVFTRWLPGPVRRRLPSPRQARSISFAVPAEKVTDFGQLEKTKDFPCHLVDPDLASATAASFFSAVGADRYVFETEEDYYADLRTARFGVTTKRAGWDCLRHYELAANGCVLCFRDLDRKPPTCAPHGLTPANSVAYRSPDDLARRITGMTSGEYQELLAGTRAWIANNTTERLARRFLSTAVD
jgi:hypothetical protein